MSLIERIRSFLQASSESEHAKDLAEKAADTSELLRSLDTLLTKHGIEQSDVEEALAETEREVERLSNELNLPGITEREKNRLLSKLRLTVKKVENLEGRFEVYEKSMHMHLNLLGRVQKIEAMALTGVSDEEIEKIIENYEEKKEEYRDLTESAEVPITEKIPQPSAKELIERRELLERIEKGTLLPEWGSKPKPEKKAEKKKAELE